MQKVILLGFFWFVFLQLSAQTLTLTLTKNPCKNDGEVVASIQGVGNTTGSTWYWYYSGKSISKTNISNGTDTIKDFGGGWITVSVVGIPGTQLYKSLEIPFPFDVSYKATYRDCPLLSTVELNMAGGQSPYSVEWFKVESNVLTAVGTKNPIDLPNGLFTYKVTDGKGCIVGGDDRQKDSSFIYIYTNPGFTFEVETKEANCLDGSAKVVNIKGGKVPYSYQWSNGANSSEIKNLMKGYFQVTVTDANGCFDTEQEIQINQSKIIKVQSTSTPATCDEKNGAITLFPTGGKTPYSFKWNTGATTQNLTNIAEGTYIVNVTDADGCISDAYYTSVTNISPVQVTISNLKASSCTSPTGEATLKITGGTAPYTIEWQIFPTQTGTKLSNVPPGTYGFLVKDAKGCKRTGSVVIQPESVIYVSLNSTDAICGSTFGGANAFISGGVPPISILWSNGSTSPNINNLQAGLYSVTISDAKNCSIIKSAAVRELPPFNIALSNTAASCIYSADGSIQATITGGTAPYTYYWSNGAITPSANGLKTGHYTLFVKDDKGCQGSKYTFLEYDTKGTSCYCTIEGTVYHDINQNCNRDAGENGIENIQIHCKGIGYTYTDATGHYSFKVPSGTYELSETVNNFYPLSNCQNNKNTVTVIASSGCSQIINFGNMVNPLHDTRISLWPDNLPIPGFQHTQNLVVTNAGTITENDILINYFTDGQIGIPLFSGTSILSPIQAGIYSNNNPITLSPGKSEVFKVNYTVPTDVPLSTELYFTDSTSYTSPISNWLNDYSPWDNVNQRRETVVGSFDPNFIEVSPQGLTDEGFITKKDTTLEYMVHFQNYGNYYAQNVVVRCELNKNLIINSLKPIYGSAPYSVTLSENGELSYFFKNINLMPKSWNEELSKGFFTFSIKTKKGLLPLTKILQKADIYFDYNTPVSTNQAINTIEKTSDIDLKPNDLIEKIYPNPTDNHVYIQLENVDKKELTIIFYDILGRVVHRSTQQSNGQKTLMIDLNDFKTGIYFVGILSDEKPIGKAQKLTVINE